ncbi:MAG TPA: tail fiber domain-containing protein [Pyrinomonadaceae bacterium]|nr:tail fiber domain-containing protein [Pyrinomonadaceae bacterium]
MADNTPTKRPHYFKSQFLVLRDFEDEQAYHEEMLRLHNRGLHSWGVVQDGLQVDPGMILGIHPGTAIDSLGREIVVEKGGELLFLKANGTDTLSMEWDDTKSLFKAPQDAVQAAVTATGSTTDVYITITFNEILSDDPEDKYPPTGQQVDVTRYKPAPLIKIVATRPTDGSSITLARVSLDTSGNFSIVHNSERTLAGSFGPLSFTAGSPADSPDETIADGTPQFGLDYDVGSDLFRIRARTQHDPGLNATHLSIKRDTGNVGIGTPMPGAKLDVAGAINVGNPGGGGPMGNGSLLNFTSSHEVNATAIQENWGLNLAGTSSRPVKVFNASLLVGYQSSDGADFGTGNLLVSGKVGIGTRSPGAKLSVVAPNSTEIVGTAQSTTFRTTAGSLGDNAGDELSLASIGFLSGGGNNSSLGIRALRVSDGTDWYSTAIGLGMDVDNTVRAGGASLWLHANGNIGVGSTHPVAKFEVQAGADSDGSNDQKAIALAYRTGGYRHWIRTRHNSSGGTGNAIDFYVNNSGTTYGSSSPGQGSFHVLTVESGGVGIGTPNPSAWLSVVAPGSTEIVGAARSTTFLTTAGKLGTKKDDELSLASIGFLSGGGNNSSLGIRALRVSDGDGWQKTAIGLGMDVDDTKRAGGAAVWIHSNGNVGLGTTSPNTKLHIDGGADTALVIGDRKLAGSVGLQFLGSAYKHAALRFDGDNVIVEDASSSSLPSTWYTANNQMNFLVRNGKVGIGTTSPGAKLDVADTTAQTTKSILARLSEGNTIGVGTYLGVSSYDTQPINSNSFALEHYFAGKLNNAINFYRGGSDIGGFMTFSTNNGTEAMRIGNDGDVKIVGRIACGGKIGLKSSQWGTYVSAREDKSSVKQATALDTFEMFTLEMACSRAFKENISDLTAAEALATLQNLAPVKYDYKGEKSFRQNLGFIAEDMPDNLASQDRKSISPFEVIPVLTRVAKEQQQIITALQATIRALQEQMQQHHTLINGDRI